MKAKEYKMYNGQCKMKKATWEYRKTGVQEEKEVYQRRVCVPVVL